MTSVNQKASIENPLKENFKTDIKNNQILKLRFQTAGTKNETLAGFRLFKMISTVLGSPSLTQQKLSIFEISQGSTLSIVQFIMQKFIISETKSSQFCHLWMNSKPIHIVQFKI